MNPLRSYQVRSAVGANINQTQRKQETRLQSQVSCALPSSSPWDNCGVLLRLEKCSSCSSKYIVLDFSFIFSQVDLLLLVSLLCCFSRGI